MPCNHYLWFGKPSNITYMNRKKYLKRILDAKTDTQNAEYSLGKITKVILLVNDTLHDTLLESMNILLIKNLRFTILSKKFLNFSIR